jgi:hypothetical protein
MRVSTVQSQAPKPRVARAAKVERYSRWSSGKLRRDPPNRDSSSSRRAKGGSKGCV